MVTEMALENFRVLNLTRDRGLYAGKLMADLGADVIKVEKPQGDIARNYVPFKDDIPDQETSLYFLNFHINQRSVTLDLDTPAGKNIFKQLVEVADVVIEDFQPGQMEAKGLGYQTLRDINRGIIMTSITGFGQEGPYADYIAPDIVNFAMGGLMYISGDPAKPPVVAPCEQAYHSASVLACFGTQVALYHRQYTSLGQLVEVSAHEAMAMQEHTIMRYSLETDIVRRQGSQHYTTPSRIYPCKDGFVCLFAGATVDHWKSMLEILGNPDTLMDSVWEDSHIRRLNVDVIDPIIIEFTMKHTKMELTEKCQSRNVPCTPVNTPEEFINSPLNEARDFIVEIEHPVIGKHRCLKPPYILSETPCQLRRSAPLLSQHNEEIYCGELGYTIEEIARFKTEGVI